MPAKTIHDPNFARSAMAPLMSATVMMAKTPWKPTKASVGMPAASTLARQTGLAALIATHNPALAARMDRTVRMEHGILVTV
jgi:predicted ABC-type transport system involved in lysophospholipase L1 biosynthesis ATPase subunit